MYFYSNDCCHPHPVIDVHEGTTICPECAKVLTYNMEATMQPQETIFCCYKTRMELLLHDFCCNGQITALVEKHTLTYFKTLLKYEKKHFSTNEKENDLMAFALYYSLNKNGASMTPPDVEALTGTTRGKFWQIESKFQCHIPAKMSNLVSKIGSMLKLSFSQQQEIEKIVDNFRSSFHAMGSVKDRSVLAAVIYLYSKSNKMKRSCSILHVTNVCNISRTTVRNVIKRMPKACVANICILINDTYTKYM